MIISYYISLLYSSTYYKSVLAGELSRLNFSSFSTTSVKSGLIFIIVHFLASITITTHSCNSIWSSSSRLGLFFITIISFLVLLLPHVMLSFRPLLLL